MIRLVIDTNRLPKNLSSPSAAFGRVCRLAEEGIVQVAMPNVLAEEWRTQQLEQLSGQLRKARESIKGLLVGAQLEGRAEVANLETALTDLDTLANEAEQLSNQTLQRMADQLQAEVVPIANDHGERVAKSYFSGGPPFSGVKTRKDFPDAFAYEAILDIANADQNDSLVVVTSDKNLSKHVSLIDNVTCYDTLEDFVVSDVVAEASAAVDLEANWRAALPAITEDSQVAEADIIGEEFHYSFSEKLDYIEVFHESIPSDNHDAYVSMISDPEDIDVAWDEAEDYGPGVLRVPFSCKTEVLLDFNVYYADAYGLPEYIGVQYVDPDETHYFEAQAYSTALVHGHLVVSVDDWPEEEFAANASAKVDEITKIDLEDDDGGNTLY